MSTAIMEINMPAGASEVTLKTGGKYCEKDIRVTAPFSHKTETGTHKINATTQASTSITIECPTEGLKAIVVYPDDTTLAAIQAADDKDQKRYFAALIGNFYAPELEAFTVKTVSVSTQDGQYVYTPIYGMKAVQICGTDMSTYKLGWQLCQEQSVCEVLENGVKFTVQAAVAGTYYWRAHYWNE